MKPYAVYVHSDVMHLLIQMSASRRRKLADFFAQLVADPFTRGAFTERDLHDREAQVVIFGAYVITFFADHAAREVQIMSLEGV